MRVDYDKLELAAQVLERQSDVHCTAMAEYVQKYGILTPSDTGIVLMPFTGISLLVAIAGVEAAQAYGKLCSLGAEAVRDSSRSYVEAERDLHEQLQRMMGRLGTSLPPFQDPTANPPTLGPAGTGAPADHGGGESNLFTQAYEDGGKLVSGTRDLISNAQDRYDSWSASGDIAERNNASSWLVAPNASKSEIENMRWGAGPILGSVDWIIEELTGLSFLEDVIMKPFAGNWTGIEEVQQAWEHLGEACRALSDNTAGLASSGAFWEGEAGVAYQGGMAAMSAAGFGLGYAADAVAGLVGNLLLASKAAAAAIGFALNKLSQHLLGIAATAAVPVAGWLAAGIQVGMVAQTIFSTVRLIYTIIDTIYDAIEGIVTAKADLADSVLRLNDLAQVLAQTARR